MTAVLVAARRTAVRSVRATGAAAAAQHICPAQDLGAAVLAAVAHDAAQAGHPLPREVVLGSARPQPGNLARRAALAAGLPDNVGAVTIDQQCGSGMEAIRIGAALAGAGAGLVLAAGVESISEAGTAQAAFTPAGFADPDLAEAAADLAVSYGIERRLQDEYTLRSYRLARQAAAQGQFDAELVPTPWAATDDRPRLLSPSLLARLPAHLGRGGLTRASIAGVADAAAAVALVSVEQWSRQPTPGLLLRASATVGVDPAEPGIGAAVAVESVLAQSEIPLADIAVIEMVEAFAAQQLACLYRLGLDPFDADARQICPTGGALGLGHPWGASGAIAVVRLFGHLVREEAPVGTLGLGAVSVAGGQGVATIWERVG